MNVRPQMCFCLCAVNHPSADGLCEGAADGSLRFYTDRSLSETLDVPMCSACIAATLEEVDRKARA